MRKQFATALKPVHPFDNSAPATGQDQSMGGSIARESGY